MATPKISLPIPTLSDRQRNNNDDSIFQSLRQLRNKMESGCHKYAVKGTSSDAEEHHNNKNKNTLNEEPLLTTIDLQQRQGGDDEKVITTTSPLPAMYPSPPRLTVPPLRPHVESWLQDKVPTRLPFGIIDIHQQEEEETNIRKKEDVHKNFNESSSSAATPPSSEELMKTFLQLSSQKALSSKKIDEMILPFAPLCPYSPLSLSPKNSNVKTITNDNEKQQQQQQMLIAQKTTDMDTSNFFANNHHAKSRSKQTPKQRLKYAQSA